MTVVKSETNESILERFSSSNGRWMAVDDDDDYSDISANLTSLMDDEFLNPYLILNISQKYSTIWEAPFSKICVREMP